MILYKEEDIMQAFSIYKVLAAKGKISMKEARAFIYDENVRNLVSAFADQVRCIILTQGDELILLPIAASSVHHVSNETLKRTYLSSRATNLDIYMMYVAIIILFGEFYDSYLVKTPTRDFITREEWLDQINYRISTLLALGEERLKQLDEDLEYNWYALCQKWDDLNEVKDGVKADGRSVSRLAFLKQVVDFLVAQDFIRIIGNDELEITDRAKSIVERYYMEESYNRGILEILYPTNSEALKERQEKEHANHF